MGVRYGIGYSTPNRDGTDSSKYCGARSFGDGWEILWKGPYNHGPTAFQAVRAALDNLTHLQKTDMASEANAKFMVHLIKAIEEYDGAPPSIGGDLNNLIPKAE